MNIKAGVGTSYHRNVTVAGQEAVEQALQETGIEKPDFVFMFASTGYNQQKLVDVVREKTGYAPLSGCSAWGIIGRDWVDNSNFAVAVMVISSDQLRFSNYLQVGLKENPHQVGEAIAQAIKPQITSDSLGAFLFADGISINFDRFVAGLEAKLNLDVFLPLLGGASGYNLNRKNTYQYYNDRVVSDGVVATLISGGVNLAWAVNHGCEPIGSERKVTRCEGNVIYEIDDQPVLEVLKEYLNEEEIENWSEAVGNLCLGLKAPGYMQDYDEYLIRFLPSKDDAAGSVSLQTEIAEGTSIWMTLRDRTKIISGLDIMTEQIKNQLGDRQAKLVFHFDCFGRGSIFRGEEKTQLLNRLQKNIGMNIPWLGFYTNGEIAPVGNHNCFHNYTLVLGVIY